MTAVIGASVWLKLVTVWGTPSSSTRKFSFFNPGTNMPSLVSTPTSRVTRGTLTRMEKLGIPSTFCGSLGTSSFFGGSSFFFGTAIGPMSPCGPPASPVALGCCAGVGVGVAAVCPWAKRQVPPADNNPRVRTKNHTAEDQQVNTLENENDRAVCIKRISACLFEGFYSSIDARTLLSRSHFLSSGRGQGCATIKP